MLQFWRDLVSNHNISLVVNLCNDVGDDIMMWHECCQYWPNSEKPAIQLATEDNIKIELINEDMLSENLKKYDVKIISGIAETTESEQNNNQKSVTLLHFFGWPDAAAPFWPDASTSFEPD